MLFNDQEKNSIPSKSLVHNSSTLLRKRVLIIDEKKSTRLGLQELIESWGFEPEVADNTQNILDRIHSFQPHVIITDLCLPKLDGLTLLKKLDTNENEIAIILLTSQGSIESAVEAIKLGAYDYLTRPVDIVRLKHLLERLNEKITTEDEIKRLRRELRQLGSFGELLGTTPVMQELFHQIELIAPSTASVLISGPSGTGKELVARTIHKLSNRSKGPFVPINCSAIPATLLESELFGHEKGAFTGAIKTKEGSFELADNGTLFLDEIATMALDLQSKILRTIENGRFRRVGAKQELQADVRMIAASNIEFDQAVENKLFREDLYYRLNVFHLKLPTLQNRKGDIPFLAQHFLDKISAANNKKIKGIHPKALYLMKNHTWPGNVRELKNAIERAVIVTKGNVIVPEDLPNSITDSKPVGPIVPICIGSTLHEIEKQIIFRTLDQTGGNKTEAAKILGISLKTMHNKLNEFKLNKPNNG